MLIVQIKSLHIKLRFTSKSKGYTCILPWNKRFGLELESLLHKNKIHWCNDFMLKKNHNRLYTGLLSPRYQFLHWPLAHRPQFKTTHLWWLPRVTESSYPPKQTDLKKFQANGKQQMKVMNHNRQNPQKKKKKNLPKT